MKTILLVDDEPSARRLLYHALKSEYHVLEAGDRETALAQMANGAVDLAVLDLHLPPRTETAEEGVRLERAISERYPLVPVVITTGDQDHGLALELVRRGVADFLLKPIDAGVLKIVIARALDRARLENEIQALREQVRERFSFGNLIGRHESMKRLFARLEKLARVKTTVLLRGESGTGKSAVAMALHNESPRADEPFVVVDGAAIPESLMESELFGHVKGAFTGADARKTGRIQTADGGTLFLDEIGNLSPAAQAKLLLFLDNHACTPVGSAESIPVDVRLVTATNLDLEKMVEEETFREDLLYRLQVATVELPPLRDRREDIRPLAERLLATLCKDLERPAVRLTDDALELLEGYPWPGNVRQLGHVLESSLVLADGDRLDAGDLTLPAPPAERPSPDPGSSGDPDDPSSGASFKEQVTAFERSIVERAIEKSGGNKAAAGRLLGLDDNQIRYLCRKHGIR